MDFRFSEKEQALQKELREFAKAELPSDWRVGGYADEYCTDDGFEMAKKMSKKLAEKGWLTMAWPKEYGGMDATRTEYLIYREEMAYNMVPGVDMGVGGVSWIGQTIIMLGTEEQKKKYLPGIAAGETYWCTGYSEPEAGTDLASMTCRAIKKGDEYVINGQKVWTSAAHRSAYCWLAVRTDPDAPKHKGISILLVDLNTSGVDVKPLINLAGVPENCEMFFDDAHVPADCLIDQENNGWHAMMTALSFERTAGIEHLGRTWRLLDEIIAYAKETKRNGKRLVDNPNTRNKLAQLTIECEIGRLMCYSVASIEDKGEVPGYEASMAKNWCAELGLDIATKGIEIMGLYGELVEGYLAPIGGITPQGYMFSIGDKIGAGTSEINRVLIATRGLGLPRN